MSDIEKLSNIDKITEGPISKTIISLALPIVLGMMMEFALLTTDFYWVGKLGASAQDAITSSMVIIWSAMASIAIISIGLTAIIARYVGARDFEKVNYFISQGIYLGLIIGVVVSISGYFFAPDILVFMETSPQTLSHAVPYIKIFFIATTLLLFVETFYAIFRASGDTKTPLKVGAFVVGLNIILDPILIFGFGPIPAMGVKGAAIGSAISILVGAIIFLYYFYGGKLPYPTKSLFVGKLNFVDMKKIATIGLPMFVQQFTFVSVYWFLIKIVHQYGESAGAAMGIGNRMESFSYLTCFGFSLAAATMVGQNLGAGKPERAEKCAWGAVGLAVALTTIISILFFTVPEKIAGFFSDDPEVIRMASDYLMILGISQTTMAIEIVIENSFSGAGNTIPPMVVMIPGAVARIPLAYFLCFTLDWGLNGVWWTMTFTTVVKAIILALWFKKGNWKLKEI